MVGKFVLRSVLAVPPRIASQLTFFPPLRQTQIGEPERIQTWRAGHAKFVSVYDAPFWQDAGLSGGAMSRHGPLAETHYASGPDATCSALFGFVGLPPEHRMQRKAAIKTTALHERG